jgi:archaeosine-15-forming tRNA-guanine transglycosylase
MGFEFTRPGSGGYGKGPGLVDLVQGVADATDDALPRMAEKAAARMLEVAVDRTPRKTGRTRESFYQRPVIYTIRDGVPTLETGIASDYFVARLLEHGVHPHLIPEEGDDRVVRFREPGGKEVFAKHVHHPGSRATHAVAVAAATTEAEFLGLVETIMRRWKRESEILRRRSR